jgi:hypothetical protein
MAKKNTFAEQFRTSYERAMTSADQERLDLMTQVGRRSGANASGEVDAQEEHLEPAERTPRAKSLVPAALIRPASAVEDQIVSGVENGVPKMEHHGAPEAAHLSEGVHLGAPEAAHHKRCASFGAPEMVHQNRSASTPRVGHTPRSVLAVLVSLNDPGFVVTTNMRIVSDLIDVPLATTKKALYRLIELGIVRRVDDPSQRIHYTHTSLMVDPAHLSMFGITLEELKGLQKWRTKNGVPEMAHRMSINRLERWRRIYLSDKPEEMDTWPNLVDIGLTEEMLLEDLDIREEKGVPASIFDEDMAVLNYNFGQPEWVKKIRTKPLRFLRACIVQGDAPPAPGYESPIQARIKTLRARREAKEKELKALEVEEIETWWFELPDETRGAYIKKFKDSPEDTRKRIAWNKWRKSSQDNH